MGASLDEHAVSGRRRERRHDGDRRGDDKRARTGDDEKHQRAIEPRRWIASGHKRRHDRDDGGQCDDRRRVDTCESIDEGLNRRAPGLRGFNEVDDSRESRVSSDADHFEVERSPAVDRAGVHLVARTFVDGKRFAGDRRLVDVAMSGQDPAVERDFVAGPHDDLGAHRDGLDRRAVLDAISLDDGLAG